MSANTPPDMSQIHSTNDVAGVPANSLHLDDSGTAEHPATQSKTASAGSPAEHVPEVSAPKSADYVVGFRKPPKHTQFRPGHSGNPKGRQKGAKGMKTLARQILTTRVPVRSASGTKMMTRMDALLHKMVELSMKGNPRLILTLIDLYQQSVPEQRNSEAPQHAPSLTGTDEATLAMLKELLLVEGEKS
jgi:hypothetical protein